MITKDRESNFELLRIFAMILIIIHHITVHVLYKQMQPGYLYGPGELFNNLAYYKKLTFVDFGFQVGKIGNALFLLLSGYFLCNKKEINISKTIKKLLSQVLFITLALVIFGLVLQFFIRDIPTLPTLQFYNDEWWFIGYYIIVIIASSIILKKYKLSKKQYETILFILLALSSLHFIRMTKDLLSSNISICIIGVFYYLLGGYIKKYNPFKNISNTKLFISLLVIFGLSALSYRNFALANINASILNKTTTYYQKFITYNEYNITIIITAIIIFELFKRLKIKNNKIINNISKVTFMTYLIHDNTWSRTLMNIVNLIYYLHNNTLQFVIRCFALILSIFIASLILYKIYEFIINFTKKSQKI